LFGQNTSNFDKWWTPENDALAAAPENHELLFENETPFGPEEAVWGNELSLGQ
jgi:hypothetical protein